MRIRRRLWRNTLTYIGTSLVALALLFIGALSFFDIISPEPNPYIGLLVFLALPVVLVFGAVLSGLGILVASWRFKRDDSGRTAEFYPRIDLEIPSHRRVLMIIGSIIVLSIPFIGVMSYQGYNYTESDSFCGGVCHQVMEPQHVAHQKSPHARVPCATCHIGHGASWYVKSKISGLRQVLAITMGSFPRPIPNAIEELRPARETCERCHWPQKFYGDQLVTVHHFAADEANSPRILRMMMKTGGNDPTTAPPSGIHWHMALSKSIEFIATDPALQEIPWVRMTDHETNTRRIYRSDGLSSDDPPPEGEVRTMDCMSCHNRATHVFRVPWRAADEAFLADPQLTELPFAKRELIAAVVEPYETKEQGLHEVATALEDFYEINYPEVARDRRPELKRLIEAGERIYNLITFPEMKVTWKTYPDNIGHKNYPGCFRCHVGDHVDDHGRAVSHECAACHTFLTPFAAEGDSSSLISEGDFVHPVELEGRHEELRCSLCHDGGIAPAADCAECHTTQSEFLAGTTEAFERFEIEEDLMNGIADCADCHVLSQPTEAAAIDATCLDCHAEDEEGFPGMAQAWAEEVAALLDKAERVATPEQEEILRILREAGPLHNMEATRRVLTAIAAESPVAPETTGEAEEI